MNESLLDATEGALTDNEDKTAVTFLAGPLFKEAKGAVHYLEVFDPTLRQGAQTFGYRDAAQALIDLIIERPQEANRTLLHPILFLYRHSVELRLKHMIAEYGLGSPNLDHKLKGLWNTFKVIAKQHAIKEELDKAGRLIDELHTVDENSQAFRYATDREGGAFEFKFEAVDLMNLRKQMDDLDTFFFGLEAVMDEWRRNAS